jgi:aminoglycoside phosphotransferase family enzyme
MYPNVVAVWFRWIQSRRDLLGRVLNSGIKGWHGSRTPYEVVQLIESGIEESENWPPLIRGMTQPSLYPHPCDSIYVRITSTSWLIFAGDFVYKVKKPVRHGSVEASTPSRRYQLCRDEWRLNSRFSPDIYPGVAGLRDMGHGYELAADASAAPEGFVEYAVVMRRIPDEQMLERVIVAGRAATTTIQTIADKVAASYRVARPVSANSYRATSTLERLVSHQLAQIDKLVWDSIAREQVDRAQTYLRSCLSRSTQLFDCRYRDGWIRDGHGDLRSDNVFVSSEAAYIIGRIEFDKVLRRQDIAADIGALVVDLDLLNRSDLGEQFVRRCVDVMRDENLPRILPFYKVFRALLRGKRGLAMSSDSSLPAATRLAELTKARDALGMVARYAVPIALT